MKTKALEYCYPTSPNANYLGFSKTGCWFVGIKDSEDQEKDEELHPTTSKAEAIAAFEAIDLPINTFYSHKY